MATDATGTPTALGIPKFNTSVDAPSGLGSNAQMDSIDGLIQANTGFQGAGIVIKGNKLVSTDANNAFSLFGDGTHKWGAGGASALDTTLARSSAGVLTLTGTLNATVGYQIGGTSIFASPAFTGVPTAPTAPVDTNSTQIATTAFVLGQGFISNPPVLSVFGRVSNVVATTGDYTVSQITGAAPSASPTFTGTVVAPTAATGDNSTTVATTAFVKAQAYATLASPALTGSPTAPTAATGDNSTLLATTAFVKAQSYLTASGAVTSFKGRTGAVTPASADYTAAQVTNAADLSSASQQTFTGVVSGPQFIGVGPTSPTVIASGNNYTPSGLSMGNWVENTSSAFTAFTVNNPAGVAGGTSKVGLMAVTYTNNAGVGVNPTVTWGSSYVFGGLPSQPGGVNAAQSYTWLFYVNMPQSRCVCIGATEGAWS